MYRTILLFIFYKWSSMTASNSMVLVLVQQRLFAWSCTVRSQLHRLVFILFCKCCSHCRLKPSL